MYIITPNLIEKTETSKFPKIKFSDKAFSWHTVGISIGMAALATAINFLLYPILPASNLIMVYLLAVTVVASFGRIVPSVLVSVLSVLAYDFFFVPPFYSFAVSDIRYIFTLPFMLLVALIISNLTIFVRRQADAARFAERHTAVLHTLSRQLASVRGVDKLLNIASAYLGEIFDSHVLVLLPENNHNQLIIKASYGAEEFLNEKEQSVAQWVFDLGQMAGLGTDTLSFSKALYIPLLAPIGTIGVLRIKPVQPGYLFTPEQLHLLQFCISQITLALEADRLEEQSKKTELQHESDRIHHFLLESISHEMRTPLKVAMSSANMLMKTATKLDPDEIKKLTKSIYAELAKLNQHISAFLK